MREEMESSPTDDVDQAVVTRRRDHVLDETLVCISLLNERELTRIQAAQSHCDNGADSPLSASAVRIRLGDILLREKRVTSSQLEQALALQREYGGLLGEILVKLGWIDQSALDAALFAQACAAIP